MSGNLHVVLNDSSQDSNYLRGGNSPQSDNDILKDYVMGNGASVDDGQVVSKTALLLVNKLEIEGTIRKELIIRKLNRFIDEKIDFKGLLENTGSSKSFLLPTTISGRLSILSDKVADIAKDIENQNYKEAINDFGEMSNSIRVLSLSEGLSSEISENLEQMMVLIDSINYLVYGGLKNNDIEEVVEKNAVSSVLESAKNTLKAFSEIDKWKMKMQEEWGDSKSQ